MNFGRQALSEQEIGWKSKLAKMLEQSAVGQHYSSYSYPIGSTLRPCPNNVISISITIFLDFFNA